MRRQTRRKYFFVSFVFLVLSVIIFLFCATWIVIACIRILPICSRSSRSVSSLETRSVFALANPAVYIVNPPWCERNLLLQGMGDETPIGLLHVTLKHTHDSLGHCRPCARLTDRFPRRYTSKSASIMHLRRALQTMCLDH